MKHSIGDSCRADTCIGAGCEHCRDVEPHVRPAIPAEGTPEREAIVALMTERMNQPRDEYRDEGR